MLSNLLIAAAFLAISAIALLNFNQFYQFLSLVLTQIIKTAKRIHLLINTLVRAYSRYQKLSSKTYLTSY